MLDKGYGHDYFKHMNLVSKEKFARVRNVVYLSIEDVTLSRRVLDPTVFHDGVHMCSPGLGSLPIFIVKRLLHVIYRKSIDRESSLV